MRDQQPTFSLIIPTYRRPEQLSLCLRTLTQLDYPRDRFEVIVVDDGSETPMDHVIESFVDTLMVTLIRQANAGPATARNTGAVQARGRLLAFTDDDCAPAPNWLRTLAARFAETPADAIAGRTFNALPDNPYATASQLLVSFLFAYHNADPDQARFATTSNLALPADTFRALKGFDPAFPVPGGEDYELCRRWLSHGYRLRYAPEAVVYHTHALTLRTFLRQHFHYGRGAYHLRRASVPQKGGRRGRQPFRFHWQLFHYARAQRPGQRTAVLLMLLLMAQVVNAAGSCWERCRQSRWR
ncbi:MAG TPA: glycosyltransferase [Candidatus Binatia bacterium]|jgi:GT2 family glycosyltransferase|nr:glycosyltransferase [Candidatus Binatia bacterium]